jgi:hypothetical protein
VERSAASAVVARKQEFSTVRATRHQHRILNLTLDHPASHESPHFAFIRKYLRRKSALFYLFSHAI